jgi:Tol biopolymer transport system component
VKSRIFWTLLSIVLLLHIPNPVGAQARKTPLYLMYAQEDKGTFLAEVSTVANGVPSIESRHISNEFIIGLWSPQAKTFISTNGKGVTIQSTETPDERLIVKYDPKSDDASKSDDTYMSPSISPDGRRFMFIKNRFYFDSKESKYGLILGTLDGSIRPIFDPQNSQDESGLSVNTKYMEMVRWSPDSAYIAFSGNPFHELGENNIYLMSTECIETALTQCNPHTLKINDGSGIRLRGRAGLGEDWNYPTWSPDSKRLAFRCEPHLCILGRDGTNFRRILLPLERENLEWSPDGQFLAYMFNNDIYLLSLNTYHATRLTNNTDYDNDIYSLTWLTLPDADFLLQ